MQVFYTQGLSYILNSELRCVRIYFPQTVSESSSGCSTFSVDHDVLVTLETRDDLLHQQQQTKESLEEKATMKEVKKVELVQDIPPVKDKTPDPQGNYLLSEPLIQKVPTF